MAGIVTKSEKVLLAASAAFFCLLAASVYLPEEPTPESGAAVETGRQAAASLVVPVSGARIDLNTAGAEELTELPGIGEVLAERIVAYREESGPFRSVEDLQNVEGVGPGKFAALEDLITVGNPPEAAGTGERNG